MIYRGPMTCWGFINAQFLIKVKDVRISHIFSNVNYCRPKEISYTILITNDTLSNYVKMATEVQNEIFKYPNKPVVI